MKLLLAAFLISSVALTETLDEATKRDGADEQQLNNGRVILTSAGECKTEEIFTSFKIDSNNEFGISYGILMNKGPHCFLMLYDEEGQIGYGNIDDSNSRCMRISKAICSASKDDPCKFKVNLKETKFSISPGPYPYWGGIIKAPINTEVIPSKPPKKTELLTLSRVYLTEHYYNELEEDAFIACIRQGWRTIEVIQRRSRYAGSAGTYHDYYRNMIFYYCIK